MNGKGGKKSKAEMNKIKIHNNKKNNGKVQ